MWSLSNPTRLTPVSFRASVSQPRPGCIWITSKWGDWLAGLLGVAGVGEQDLPPGSDQQVTGRTGEARQVAAVFAGGNENGVQFLFGQQGGQSGYAIFQERLSSSMMPAMISIAEV